MSESRIVFASDLHSDVKMYDALAEVVDRHGAQAVIIGGDLFAYARDDTAQMKFVEGYLQRWVARCSATLYWIAGNTDWPSAVERLRAVTHHSATELGWTRAENIRGVRVIGYPWIPPSPFRIKHWEKTDANANGPDLRGAVVAGQDGELQPIAHSEWSDRGTIAADLAMVPSADLWVTHSPPRARWIDTYRGDDGTTQHAGSQAIRHAILRDRPAYTLHGHLHDAESITGRWHERLGDTTACNCGRGSSLRSILLSVRDGLVTDVRMLAER